MLIYFPVKERFPVFTRSDGRRQYMVPYHHCAKCCLPLPIQNKSKLCNSCQSTTNIKFGDGVERIIAATLYLPDDERSEVDLFLNREIMKMKEDGSFAHIYAEMLTRQICQVEKIIYNEEATFVVPIPRKDGQDKDAGQVSLAFEIGHRLDLPMKEMLVYHNSINKQHYLRAGDRRHNVQGTMETKFDLSNEDIFLVDDIMTTGSTLNEASKVLKEAGAFRVYGLVAARTVSMGLLEQLGLVTKGKG